MSLILLSPCLSRGIYELLSFVTIFAAKVYAVIVFAKVFAQLLAFECFELAFLSFLSSSVNCFTRHFY
jgi:hypothetical protein